MLRTALTATLVFAACAGAAQAHVKRTGTPTGAISSVVSVPAGYGVVYVSGMTAGGGGQPISAEMDTKAQTIAILEKIKTALAGEGLTLGDVTMMNVYLVGVAANGGRMDSAGMNEAYRTYFGTAEQPNKPARATVQVAALGSPTTLVEISVQAAKKP